MNKLATGLPALTEHEAKKIKDSLFSASPDLKKKRKKYDWAPLVVGGGLGAAAALPLIIALRGKGYGVATKGGKSIPDGLIAKALPKNQRLAYALGLGSDFVLSGGGGILGMRAYRKIRDNLKNKDKLKSASVLLENTDMTTNDARTEELSWKVISVGLFEKQAGPKAWWTALKGTAGPKRAEEATKLLGSKTKSLNQLKKKKQKLKKLKQKSRFLKKERRRLRTPDDEFSDATPTGLGWVEGLGLGAGRDVRRLGEKITGMMGGQTVGGRRADLAARRQALTPDIQAAKDALKTTKKETKDLKASLKAKLEAQEKAEAATGKSRLLAGLGVAGVGGGGALVGPAAYKKWKENKRNRGTA